MVSSSIYENATALGDRILLSLWFFSAHMRLVCVWYDLNTLSVWYMYFNFAVKFQSRYCHPCLKVVEIACYCNTCDFELFKHIIEIVVIL